MYNKIVSFILVFLVVCLPISFAQITKEEELTAEEGYTDLIFNVKKYEPTVIVSSLLEEQNIPVYAFLSALPTEGLSLPRIQSVSVSVIGGDKDRIAGGARYHKPLMYDWNDMGHIEIKLKKIEKEEEMPKEISVDLKAKIRYEGETTSALLGGVETKELNETYGVELTDILGSKQFGFFGEKGYVVAERISKNSATFILYNGEGNFVSRFSVGIDKESGAFSLIKGSTRPEDYVRVRVDEIIIEDEEKEALFSTSKEPIKIGGSVGSCTLEKIEYYYVRLRDANGNAHDLSLKSEYEKERESRYDYTGQVKYDDTLKSGICKGVVKLLDIDTKKTVRLTLMTGKTRGYTESVFSLHLPIEKRIMDLSPRALEKRIDKTRKQIDNLDKKYITRLDKLVKEWRKVCLVVTGVMLVYNFFKGLLTTTAAEEKAEEVKKKVEEEVKKVSKEKIKGDWYRLNDYKDADGNEIYVFGEKMDAFYTWDGKNYVPIDNSVVYEYKKSWFGLTADERKPFYWSDKGEGFIEYNGIDPSEFERIYLTTISDKSAVIIPLKDPGGLLKTQYSKWKLSHGDASKGLYAVVYDDEVEIWQGRGHKIDVLDDGKDDELDRRLTSLSNKQGFGLQLYKDLDARYLRKLKTARATGRDKVKIGKESYKIDTATKFLTSNVQCKDVMEGWQCLLLFNACDPVMCPASRCNWGGKYNVKNVIQSGLVGSTYLCLPTIEDGVLVPLCLSGILASLKNLKSHLEGYEKCLIGAKNEGKSTGICDKIRSIFVCEIIWKEMMNFFNLKGGILGLITKKVFGRGGGEYFANPVERGIDKSRKAVNFFVKDYATTVFAAYVGRSTDEIGAEVCKSAIAGKFPNLGEFMEEIAEPEDPVQFTAYFEEHAYAPTRGESRYQVYYHIYAGNPKRTETIDYKVYLHSKLSDKIIGQGTLKAGEFADESVDIIATSGYPEICVVINGVAKCGFGKSVSTSFFMDQASDWYMKNVGGLAPKITRASQCVSEEQKIGAGYVPKAAVERTCAVSNPYLGLREYKEKEWYVVGKCLDEKGRNLGQCWQRADLTRYPELKESVSEDVCGDQGGDWCNVNQTCKDGAIVFDYSDKQGRRECCLGGICADKPTLKEILFEPPETEENTCDLDYLEEINKIEKETEELKNKIKNDYLAEQEKLNELLTLVNKLEEISQQSKSDIEDLKSQDFEDVLKSIIEKLGNAKEKCEDIPIKEEKEPLTLYPESIIESFISSIRSSKCERAEDIYLNNKRVFEEMYDGKYYSKATYGVGYACFIDSNYEKAMEYFYKVFPKYKDMYSTWSFYYCIKSYYKLGQIDDAKSLLEDFKKEKDKYPNSETWIDDLDNLLK